MGKVDNSTDDILTNERFADLCNVGLFEGKRFVRPEELEEADGSLSFVSTKADMKLTADKVKKWKGQTIRILCIENQTKVDYHMVIRGMLSEALGYHKQWREKQAAHKRKKDLSPEEYLSGMGKEEKFIPIITLVVYYGDKKWDGARTLYELLEFENDAEEKETLQAADAAEKDIWKSVICNYRLNLFDYHDYEDFSRFETDLKNLFEILKWNGDEETLMEKVNSDPSYQSLEEDMSLLIGKLSGRNLEQYVEEREEGRDINMQDIFERRYQTGRNEGRIEGRNEGRIEGRSEGRNEGRDEGLAAFISILQEEGFSPDAIYEKITSKEPYKEYTRETIQAMM